MEIDADLFSLERPMSKRIFLVILVILTPIIGCNRAKSRMTRRPVVSEKAHWPALDAFVETQAEPSQVGPPQSPREKLLRSVGMNSFDVVRDYVTTEEFAQLVADLEGEPIPDEYATPEREQLKARTVELLRQLIADAEEGASDEEIAADVDAFSKTIVELRTISD